MGSLAREATEGQVSGLSPEQGRAGEGRSSGPCSELPPAGGREEVPAGTWLPAGPLASPAERALPSVRPSVRPQGEENLSPERAVARGLLPAALQRAPRELPGAPGRAPGGGRRQDVGSGDGGEHRSFFSALSFFGICSGFKFTHCVSNGQQKISFIFYCSFLFVLVSLIHG